MKQNIITENGFTVEQAIEGHWRLMKNGEVIYYDSACEDLNEDKETAEAFFEDYLKEYAHGVFTLEELAKYINDHDDYPLEVQDIIAANGWKDETGDEFGVASYNEKKIIMTENGKAVIIED